VKGEGGQGKVAGRMGEPRPQKAEGSRMHCLRDQPDFLIDAAGKAALAATSFILSPPFFFAKEWRRDDQRKVL